MGQPRRIRLTGRTKKMMLATDVTGASISVINMVVHEFWKGSRTEDRQSIHHIASSNSSHDFAPGPKTRLTQHVPVQEGQGEHD